MNETKPTPRQALQTAHAALHYWLHDCSYNEPSLSAAQLQGEEAMAAISSVLAEPERVQRPASDALLQQALEALEKFVNNELTVGQRYTNSGQGLLDAINALREALAAPQPAQEAGHFCVIARRTTPSGRYSHTVESDRPLPIGAVLHAHPAPQPAQEAAAVDWTKEYPGVNDFAHWLNKRRNQTVAEAFHYIVHCYRLAITHGAAPQPAQQIPCNPAEDGVCESLECPNHAQPAQEPVAEIVECQVMGQQTVKEIEGRWKFLRLGDKLYTAPQAQRQPLTKLEKLAMWHKDHAAHNSRSAFEWYSAGIDAGITKGPAA